MRVGIGNFLLVLGVASGAFSDLTGAVCRPPEEAIARLRGYLAYRGHRSLITVRQHGFLYLSAANREYFRFEETGPGDNPADRNVYVYERGADWNVVSCPADNTWERCADVLAPGGDSAASRVRDLLRQASLERSGCRFSVDTPVWHPSPDGPAKRLMGRDILRALRSFGYSQLRAAYAEDFNVMDPQVFLMVEYEGGKDFLNCGVRAGNGPRCAWGRFGQTPTAELERDILSHAYRIYPSPR